MTFTQYQEESKKTAIYPKKDGIVYTTLGLVGEAGEIANKVKKVIRDKNGIVDEETKEKISDEVGDVIWYISNLCTELQLKLDLVATENLAKLFSRKNRGVLNGEGDKR